MPGEAVTAGTANLFSGALLLSQAAASSATQATRRIMRRKISRSRSDDVGHARRIHDAFASHPGVGLGAQGRAFLAAGERAQTPAGSRGAKQHVLGIGGRGGRPPKVGGGRRRPPPPRPPPPPQKAPPPRRRAVFSFCAGRPSF